MAILDELFGPTNIPDVGSLDELLRRLQQEAPPNLRNPVSGITVQDPPPEFRGVAGREPGPVVPDFPEGVVTAAPPPVIQPPPPRNERPPPSGGSGGFDMQRFGAFLSDLFTPGGTAQDSLRRENLTVSALRRMHPDMSEEQARVIAGNPQAITAFFGPRAGPTFGIIGEDADGAKIYGWIDPRTRTTSRANISGGNGGPGGAGDTTQPPPGSNLTGDDYLRTLPPNLQSLIRQIAEGRAPYPTGQILRTPYGQRLQRMLNQYDPTLDATTWAARRSTATSFASGPEARNVTSLNTVLQHLDSLSAAVDGLGTWNVPFGEVVRRGGLNWVRRQAFPESVGAAFSRFEQARQAVATEMMKAFRSGAGVGTVREIEDWKRTLDAASSPAELHAAIAEGVKLLEGRVNALTDQYRRGMGRDPDRPFLSPETQAGFDRLRARGEGRTTPPAGDAPPGPGGPGRTEQPRGGQPPPEIPPIPGGVPADAQWSASRRQWRSGTQLFDERGRRLGTQ